jgi:hypothetical protein
MSKLVFVKTANFGERKPITTAELSQLELERRERETTFEISHPPINLANLKPSDKGREVIYTTSFERGNTFPKFEQGIISSWNDMFIFVRFGVDLLIFKNTQEPYQQQAKACSPRDLHFLKP